MYICFNILKHLFFNFGFCDLTDRSKNELIFLDSFCTCFTTHYSLRIFGEHVLFENRNFIIISSYAILCIYQLSVSTHSIIIHRCVKFWKKKHFNVLVRCVIIKSFWKLNIVNFWFYICLETTGLAAILNYENVNIFWENQLQFL